MYTIKTFNKIAKEGLKLFDENFKVDENGENYDGILLRSYNLNEDVIPLTCKAVARAGAGVNNVPVERCSEAGVVVMNTPGANANAVKELALAAITMASRNVIKASDWVQTLDSSDDVAKIVEKEKSNFKGNELAGKKVGVVGLGAIGVLVANAFDALGMDVYGFDPFMSVDAAWSINQNINRSYDIEKIFKNCDYVTLHLPLNDKTKHTVNADLLSVAKKDIKILNLARGGLVDDDAMLEAINQGKIGYYVTDFPNEKLLHNDKVICIPHLGASTPESETNCAVMAVKQMSDFLKNGNIKNSVNFPDVDMGKCQTKARVSITHKNVPNMVGQISTILADSNVNISNMINKSKGDYAYSMLDIDSIPDDAAMEKMNTIECVSMVRLIINE